MYVILNFFIKTNKNLFFVKGEWCGVLGEIYLNNLKKILKNLRNFLKLKKFIFCLNILKGGKLFQNFLYFIKIYWFFGK